MDLASIFSKAEGKGRSYEDYLEALEEERKKIQVFHRELPLSLHLVTYGEYEELVELVDLRGLSPILRSHVGNPRKS